MQRTNDFQEDLQKVLRFNYGLNKLGLHPFVGTNDPDVQRQLRATRTGLAKAQELIENEPTLLTSTSPGNGDKCKICDHVISSDEEVTRHKACSKISHTDCLVLWLRESSQCPCCRVGFDQEKTRALRLANEKLQKNIESAHNPQAVLQSMIDRVDRMASYLSTEELFALHTAIMEFDDASTRTTTSTDTIMMDSSDEIDFGEYSENEGFDWDD